MGSRPSRQLSDILRKAPSATVTAQAEPEDAPSVVLPPDDVSGKPSSIDGQSLAANAAPGPEVPLQVTVPRRIRQQLMVMAAEQDCSVRALVLRAVTTLGIEVAEDELRDKRRKP